MVAAPPRRIQIVMVEPDQHAQIAAVFRNFELKYDRRAEELDLPAVMHGVTWQQYQTLLDALPDRYLRQAYYDGTLELREKKMGQQRTKCVVDLFISSVAYEFGIPISAFGSTTITRKNLRLGVEPDESYCIANELAVRGRWDFGPEDVPPPDLVLETDMDHAYLDRLIVFAALGVSEVWKYDGIDIVFYRLTDKKVYEPIGASLAYPFLRPADIREFLQQLWQTDDMTLTKAFVTHVKQFYQNHRAH